MLRALHADLGGHRIDFDDVLAAFAPPWGERGRPPACGQIPYEQPEVASSKLLCLRLEMATTQKLWSRIEREIPDIADRIKGYHRLKAAESNLHIRYARHIAAWPVAAIFANFNDFARAKKQFLADLCRHIRLLETDFFEPAGKMLESAVDRRTWAA